MNYCTSCSTPFDGPIRKVDGEIVCRKCYEAKQAESSPKCSRCGGQMPPGTPLATDLLCSSCGLEMADVQVGAPEVVDVPDVPLEARQEAPKPPQRPLATPKQPLDSTSTVLMTFRWADCCSLCGHATIRDAGSVQCEYLMALFPSSLCVCDLFILAAPKP